jgi:hypothetical protein
MIKLPGLRLSLADLINQKLDGVAIVQSATDSLSYTFPVIPGVYLALTDCLFSGANAVATITGNGKSVFDITFNGTLVHTPFVPIILNLEQANTLTVIGTGEIKCNLYGFTYVSVKE